MELFIQIQDGQPHEHPIFGDNFRQAFPDVDTDNLPASFARFVRVEKPVVGVYEAYEGATYEWSDNFVMDVHHIRAMTAEEVTAKQDAVKADWAETGFASWLFDEPSCSFIPPTPYPDDGSLYKWDETTTSWVAVAE
jgi:hypothetical protein